MAETGVPALLRLGSVAIYVGLVLVVAGLIAGFAILHAGPHHLAVSVLAVVPVGVLVVFGGLVVVVLHRSEDHGTLPEDEPGAPHRDRHRDVPP